jgi:glucose/arabinose dehydrogenase
MQSKLSILLCLAMLHYNCKNEAKKPTNVPQTTVELPAQTAPVIAATPSVNQEKPDVFELNTDEKPIKLFPHPVSLKKGVKLTLNMPEGFNVSVAYEGLDRLRFMTISPDNRFFVLDMWNRSDNKRCKVYILEDWDETERRFKTIKTYLTGLHNANQVAFYTDKGVDYIYVTESGKVTRFPYKKGDNKPSGVGQVILKMPDTGVSYKYGGWHMTRSLAVHNNKLYVSIGSGCNACVEKEEIRATIMQMNLDGSDAKYYARGVRNAVGMKWIGEKLWVTDMGRDQIGAEVPEDMMHTIEEGQYYGFPFYYQFKGKILADKQFKDSLRPAFVKKPPVAFCGFKAHTAPLGFDYLKNFDDAALKNSFLVALHGSNMTSRNRGYSVVKVNGTNSCTDVITGFLPPNSKEEKDRLGRPCDVLMRDNKSFFVTDDMNGVLYYFWKK